MAVNFNNYANTISGTQAFGGAESVSAEKSAQTPSAREALNARSGTLAESAVNGILTRGIVKAVGQMTKKATDDKVEDSQNRQVAVTIMDIHRELARFRADLIGRAPDAPELVRETWIGQDTVTFRGKTPDAITITYGDSGVHTELSGEETGKVLGDIEDFVMQVSNLRDAFDPDFVTDVLHGQEAIADRATQ